jgi:hypothetical protein
MLPDQPFDIEWGRPLHVAPAIAPVLHVIDHLNGIVLGFFLGKLHIQQASEWRRIELLVAQTNQLVPHFF